MRSTPEKKVFNVGDAFIGTGSMEGVWEIGVIDTESNYVCFHNVGMNCAKWVPFYECSNIFKLLTPVSDDPRSFIKMSQL